MSESPQYLFCVFSMWRFRKHNGGVEPCSNTVCMNGTRRTAVERRLAPPSVEAEQLRIQSGASEMEVKDKQGGNDPAAICIRCETLLLAADPHIV